ncbi:hypothetical protein BG621_04350 [Parasaccharibacter apium]|nr:hypothetical protein BG621_04350 [Parasaccharibacter apium]
MPFHDPFLLCLLALLALLLCGDGAVRVFVRGLWRSVPVVTWRQGGCHMAGFLMAFAALGLVGHAGAAACLVALALLFFGGGAAFRPIWGVPALLGYGLSPTGLGGLGLMALCLWAAGQAQMSRVGQVVAIVLLIGLGHGGASAHPLLWLGGSVALVAIGLLVELGRDWEVLLRSCRLLRPLMLLGLMEISRQQGLSIGVETAFCALLLDVTCQTIAAIWPFAVCLSIPAPPLPGFVVGWMGLHTALGLSGGTEGWAVIGCILAIMVMGLSLGDGMVSLREAASIQPCKRVEWGIGLIIAALLPSLCGFVTQWMPGEAGHRGAWFYRLPGGDGSMIALPLFWLVVFVVWWGLSRGRVKTWQSRIRMDVLAVGMQATPLRLRPIRRLLVRGQQQLRLLHSGGAACLSALPLRDPGAAFWLVFLGGVLVVLGLTQ